MSSYTNTKNWPTYSIVLMGSAGSGKSCLVIRFISSRFVKEYDPTLEDSYRKEIDLDGKDLVLDIFDTAGTDDFVLVRDQYIREASGVICVYAINDEKSFKKVTPLHDHVMRVKDGFNSKTPFPFVICATKQDLEEDREISIEQGRELARTLNNAPFYETSAKTGYQVNEAFIAIARMIRKAKGEDDDETQNNEGAKNKKPTKKKKSTCLII